MGFVMKSCYENCSKQALIAIRSNRYRFQSLNVILGQGEPFTVLSLCGKFAMKHVFSFSSTRDQALKLQAVWSRVAKRFDALWNVG